MAQRTLAARGTKPARTRRTLPDRPRAAARRKQTGLPTFLIIGAQKCGTTSLHRYLASHPQVFVPTTKELDFFIAEKNWDRGVDWYRSHFADPGPAVAIGEASPSYTCFPHFGGVPERIANVIPDARLIYIVRDPIERMRSAYRHGLSAGMETRPIGEALLRHAHYSDFGRYALQLEQFEQHFDRSQIMVITAEDLQAKRETTVARALEFIGADPSWRPAGLTSRLNTARDRPTKPRAFWRELGDFAIKHPRAGAVLAKTAGKLNGSKLVTRPIDDAETTIDPDLRARLAEWMRPDVERLARWLEPSFDGWGLLA